MKKKISKLNELRVAKKEIAKLRDEIDVGVHRLSKVQQEFEAFKSKQYSLRSHISMAEQAAASLRGAGLVWNGAGWVTASEEGYKIHYIQRLEKKLDEIAKLLKRRLGGARA